MPEIPPVPGSVARVGAELARPAAERPRPADKRPRTYNYWENRVLPGRHAVEGNAFGIHEFMRLCRLVGAEPYVAANVGSGTPREFHD